MGDIIQAYCEFCGAELPDKTKMFSIFGVEFRACEKCTDKIDYLHFSQKVYCADIARKLKESLIEVMKHEMERGIK